MTVPSGQLAGLSTMEKRELLARLLRERRSAARSVTAPASFAQRRLWFMDQLTPGGTAYNIWAVAGLRGTLSYPAFVASLREIVRRHETLRTTFRAVGDELVQVITPQAEISVPLLDLRGLATAEGEREARLAVAAIGRWPYDLGRGPLLRPVLMRLSGNAWVVLLTLHHIIADGWSLGVLRRELITLYEAFAEGRSARLPKLSIQYGDFAQWQQQWLRGELLDAQLAYWTEHLAQGHAVLELPTDRPRPPVRRFLGAEETFALPPWLREGLMLTGRRQGVTLFIVLLAAFQALLARHSGQTAIRVGSPVANRSRRELEGLIGLFANVLVLQGDLSGDPEVGQLLHRIRTVALQAFAHQDVPFERLVEAVQPERSTSHTPLFQVSFALQNATASMPGLALPGLTPFPFNFSHDIVKVDLNLEISDTPEELAGILEYDRELFDRTTILRLIGRFRLVLESFAASQEVRLNALPLLPEWEKAQLHSEWSATFDLSSCDRCLHELFAQRAARCPDAVALVAGESELTYAELDLASDRLAAALQAAGIGPEERTGLALERSPEMVTTLLGILKAGAAYVPLDPDLPPARLRDQLADSAPRLLLTSPQVRSRFEGFSSAILDPADLQSAVAIPSGALLAAGPDNLAYITYTSGSTGRPKGIPCTHRNAVSFLRFLPPAYSLGPGDRVLQLPSLAFDAAVRDLLGPLLAGATVVLPGSDEAKDPVALLALVCEQRITALLSVVPTLLRALAAAAGGGRLPCELRLLLTSGERLSQADVARARRVFGEQLEVVNQYGPTECTMVSSYHRLVPGDTGGAAGAEISLGRPIAGRRFYVLDAGGALVPPGAAGELHIGGPGLARGYLGQPGSTAAKLVPDPFSRVPGERLYATGDRVRHRPDGTLQFLGRIDQQVKVRGLRIEPGEIESALASLSGVRGAAVVPYGDGLAAYVEGTGLAAEPLRRQLAECLPDAMIPARFAVVPELPRTPSGKIDRRSLPPVDEVAGDADASPHTPLEELLVGIFSEVLGREQVGTGDDFFASGGHSLLATQVVSRIRYSFGVDLPLRAIFETPTPAGLAAIVERSLRASAGGAGPPPLIERASRDEPLPLSFAQQRLWFLDRLSPGSPVYNLGMAVLLTGPLHTGAFAASLREIERRHEALRTTFAEEGDTPVQVIHPGGTLPVPRVDLRSLPSREQRLGETRRLAREEARLPFDLARGPLFRVCLVVLEEQIHALLATMHHIVGDAWSLDLAVRELSHLYPALAAGHPPPLSNLSLQYADYAVWQRRWLAGERLAREIAWWRELLGGTPPVLDLPLDRPRPPVPTFRGAHQSLRLPTDLSRRLEALSRKQGATLFMTLLAGFYALLSRTTGQDDLTVGTPIAGRSQLQTEELIGFFVNTLVLRTDLAGDPDVPDLLARVRETSLGAYAHQDLPFEKLVEELQPQRSLSHSPLFQVVFVLQNAPAAGLGLPGLRAETIPLERRTARLDLTLVMGPEGNGTWSGYLEHNLDLFDGTTVQRMADHLLTLLAEAVVHPERRLSELPLLAEPERAQLLVEWNDAEQWPEWEELVHAAIAAQAEQTPDAAALVCEGAAVTYGEMRRRAGRLAGFLLSRDLGYEPRIGVCVEPSPEMIIALLGVLEAGGAYLPLDPSLPFERLGRMLADAEVRIVLTQTRLRPLFATLPVESLCLDREWERVEAALPAEGGATVLPESAAYLIYTSGSTGTPKGVVALHRGLANFARAMAETLDVRPGDRMLQFASLAFDASAVQIFPTLLRGAVLVLHSRVRSLSSAELDGLCAREGVTLLDLPAALWRQWVAETAASGRLAAPVRVDLTGGEAVPASALRAWASRRAPGTRFLSSYGPTEATVTTTVFQTSSEDAASVTLPAVPLGRPLRNARVYVLDRHLGAVPLGVPGELWIGGAGVTRGYLGDPDLTADRYRPDPWAAQPGGRLYRTGDQARRLSDGALEFLGRRDHQVKLRGHRIELEEIEAALGSCPGVREKAVLLREDRPGDHRLVAYVVLEPQQEPTADDLQQRLREVLPEPMMPSLFVFLPALPLTSSGKLDRRALPVPTRERVVAESFEPPRTVLELQLAGIWEDLLGAPVGVRDSFFELGGHSLLSVRLMAQVRQRFGRDLPLASLFQGPTIEHMARQLSEDGEVLPWSPLVPIQSRGAWTPFFCIHPIGGEVLAFYALSRRLGPDQPFYGLQAPPLAVQGGAAVPTIEAMAADYLAAIRAFRPQGPYLLGGSSFGGVVAFEMARQLTAQGEEVSLLALFDTPVPLEGDEIDLAAVIAGLARERARQSQKVLPLTANDLRGLGVDEQLARALEGMRLRGLVGPEVDIPLMHRFIDGYVVRRQAVDRYRAGEYCGRISLFRAEEFDPESFRHLPEERRRQREDPTLGWGSLAAGGVDVHWVPGLHDTMLLEPHVGAMAEILADCILRASQRRER